VGTVSGDVWALNADTGTPLWGPLALDTTPVKGYIWTDFTSNRVYLSTDGKVHAVSDNGGSAALYWTTPVTVPNASAPILWNGRVYVGGGNSRLYSIDATSTTPAAPLSVVLGDPAVPKVVGSPAYDVPNGLMLAGTDQGAVYGVTIPFP